VQPGGVGIRLKGKAKGREGEKKKNLSPPPSPPSFPSSHHDGFCKSIMVATINRDSGTRVLSRKTRALKAKNTYILTANTF